MRNSDSITIKKIENGYLVTHSTYSEEFNYQSKDYAYPTLEGAIAKIEEMYGTS